MFRSERTVSTMVRDPCAGLDRVQRLRSACSSTRELRFTNDAAPRSSDTRKSRTIVETVRSLLNINYGQFEVIVINDGSDDDTCTRSCRRSS